MKLSIIIPVLNEEELLKRSLPTLDGLRKLGHEVIVVDGGSKDASINTARPMVDMLLQCSKGRARQLNYGASRASGDIYIFLHADTALPEEVDSYFRNMLANEIWGRFDVKLSGQHFLFRIIEFSMNFRSRYTGIATGDQAIFVSSSLFAKLTGFAEIEIMEDIEFCSRLRRIVAPQCSKLKVTTSSRRWEVKGIVTTVLKMHYLRLRYALGADPVELARIYER